MLMFLPLLCFAVIILFIYGVHPAGEPGSRDWRWILLLSACVMGGLLTLTTEVLSLGNALTQAGVAGAWILLILIAVVLLGRGNRPRRWLAGLSSAWRSLTRAERLVLIGMGGISGILLAVAWASPPNNNDSLLYHISRVVHWAQNRSVRHYPTAYDHQLIKPPWSEYAMLNLRLLWGNDLPTPLVQWGAMVSSVIGVSAIAGLLGASRRGQILAAAIAISIPMGILQSTSTQNDYVVAFWLVCMAYFTLILFQRRLGWVEVLGLGLSFGLGILTKGTFFVYAPPLILIITWQLWKRYGLLSGTAKGLVLILAAIALNLGFWQRNIQTYGAPFGEVARLQANFTFNLVQDSQPSLPGPVDEPGQENPAPVSQPSETPDSTALMVPGPLERLLASTLKNIAQNLGTPFDGINAWTTGVFNSVLRKLGEEPDDPLINSYWNHEDLAGNLMHVLLVPLTLIGLIIFRKQSHTFDLTIFAVVALGMYLLLGAIIGHSDGLYGIRYQLPFFVLWSGLAAAAFTRGSYQSWILPGAGVLLVLSLPWVLFNQTRPVIEATPWITRTGSVFTTTSDKLVFANQIGKLDEYQAAVALVNEEACTQVGLKINSSDQEYPFWWLLDAPRSDLRIEVINPPEYLEKLVDPGFTPCVVLCTICREVESIGPLVKIADYGTVQVFR